MSKAKDNYYELKGYLDRYKKYIDSYKVDEKEEGESLI